MPVAPMALAVLVVWAPPAVWAVLVALARSGARLPMAVQVSFCLAQETQFGTMGGLLVVMLAELVPMLAPVSSSRRAAWSPNWSTLAPSLAAPG